ncbi:dynein heavy chain, putative [Trichomonas vaginalis G3]|uniref:Dynein heavy chain, cytoplasmic n=1 Tax=Trichomonas vaginalis (strain ATCC PRA-98 / G3) TaxID=412133 RepID=A2HSG2_TRIV3|nr:dynein heavy chain, putative [Trichomonas vaginalis G3]|eukprot:XP_001280585.1 dynein heavy chain [Trichomonas vaginalis G3]
MWNWKKQLRFYFRSGICYAEMGDSVIPYGYEYQGNPQRLVYTNLTAKCYLTLCEGISLGYGGNPYGPAGTGKTESVKALGQALGRQVLVFNCDEAIDVQSMCRIFTGLVMGGAWGCFDEFNRLDEEVLSALSQQIQVIQTAILNKASNVII